MSRLDRRWSQVAIVVLWVAAIIALWEAAAWLIQSVIHLTSPTSKLPYLHKVLGSMGANLPNLIKQGSITFGNSTTGFLIGSAFGFLLAIIMSLSKTVENTLSPYMIASQMIPIIGLAPIIYGIVHDPNLSRVFMAAYVTFFPVTIHSLRGLKGIPSEQIELMNAYAASTWSMYMKLKLKAALPGMFAGLKLSAPLAITASIIVELMGAPDGIGVLMISSLYYGTAQVYVFWCTVLVSIGIGFASYVVIALLERWLTPWQPEFRSLRGESA